MVEESSKSEGTQSTDPYLQATRELFPDSAPGSEVREITPRTPEELAAGMRRLLKHLGRVAADE